MLQATWTGHRFAIYAADFDASGQRQLTASQDGTVRIWRGGTGSEWNEVEPAIVVPQAQVLDARFLAGGSVLVRTFFDEITIWKRVDDGWSVARTLASETTRSRSCAAGGDGTLVAVGTENGAVVLWRGQGTDWSQESELQTGSLPVTSLAVSSDGTRVAAGTFDGVLAIWQRAPDEVWRLISQTRGDELELKDLAFSHSGERLLVGSLAGIRVFDMHGDSWKESGQLSGERMVMQGAFDSSDARLVATNCQDALALLWLEERPGQWVVALRLQADGDWTRAIAFSPRSPQFVSVGNDANIRVWTPGGFGSWRSSMKVLRGIGLVQDVSAWTEGHTSFREPTAESRNGQRKATGDVYGIVRIIDMPTGTEVAAFAASDDPRYALRFSGDERRLQVIDPDSGVERRSLDTTFSVALHGDELLDAMCTERLSQSLAVVSEQDVAALPVLGDRLGDDVRSEAGLAAVILRPLRRLFGL